jgi:hypothetical protein
MSDHSKIEKDPEKVIRIIIEDLSPERIMG